MIFDVRNEEGVSEHIAWQIGVAEADSIVVKTGVSWRLESSGDHEIRIFVISDL